jgi:hypothetical protein
LMRLFCPTLFSGNSADETTVVLYDVLFIIR